MKDHNGCVRAFHWSSKAWYHRLEDKENVSFGMYNIEGGGTTGEMSMVWIELAGALVPQLQAFNDSWNALSLFPDLIEKMGKVDDYNLTAGEFVKMLLSCGFIDLTAYESPYEPNLKLEKVGAIMKPKIVVMCGSSKFVDIMAVAEWLIERDELAITMGLNLLPQWYPDVPADHLAEQEGCAEEMDELHLRKIDLCDEIFVVDWDGYIGPSTANEIMYTEKQKKRVRYFSSDFIGKQVCRLVTNLSNGRG